MCVFYLGHPSWMRQQRFIGKGKTVKTDRMHATFFLTFYHSKALHTESDSACTNPVHCLDSQAPVTWGSDELVNRFSLPIIESKQEEERKEREVKFYTYSCARHCAVTPFLQKFFERVAWMFKHD
jgi:hypothetical protein